MPKKSSSKEGGNAIFDVVKELFSNLIFSQIVTWFKETIHEIQDTIYLTTKKILESALAVFLMVLGVAMIVLSLPFLLSTYLELPASLFFMLIGLILIIISIISLDRINKTKYKRFKEE